MELELEMWVLSKWIDRPTHKNAIRRRTLRQLAPSDAVHGDVVD